MGLSKRNLLEQFEKLDLIGQGSYGVVYKVRCKRTNEMLALKRVKLNVTNNCIEEGVPSSSLREIASLKSLKHPNILTLNEVIHTGTSIYLVFEYIHQDLKKTLERSPGGIAEPLAKNYLYQLLKAIAYCHCRRIIHRDLKLQNILVDNNGTVKLADFGLARNFSIPLRLYSKEVVTLWYRCPELLLGSQYYGPSIDIWSLACIFYEITSKKVLFPGDSEIDQLFKIFKILGTPDASQWADICKLPHYKANFPKWPTQELGDLCTGPRDAADLLHKMLKYDPFKRISALDASKHTYFDDINKRQSLRDIQNPLVHQHMSPTKRLKIN